MGKYLDKLLSAGIGLKVSVLNMYNMVPSLENIFIYAQKKSEKLSDKMPIVVHSWVVELQEFKVSPIS